MSEGAPEGTGSEGQKPEGQQNPPAPTGATQQTGSEPDYKSETERLREELKKFRRMEDQLKAMRPKAQKFDEMQQAALTAEERAQLAVQTAAVERDAEKNRAASAERELAKYKAAAKHGIKEEDMTFLEGIGIDDLDKAAEKLAKRLKMTDIPNFDGGPRTDPPATSDMGDFLRQQIDRARGRR
jgi:hypothetical protein